jgi:hypothetical protein
LGGREEGEGGVRRDIPKKTLDAVQEYAFRLRQALRAFRASDDPLWKRTQDGLAKFQGLPMTDLPPRLIQDIDRRFGAINAILARYSLGPNDDYHTLSPDDLIEIQNLIEGFALDE